MTERTSQQGFTLVEMLVAMLVALVIMAGLVTTFVHQHRIMNYWNRRSDAVDDMAFSVRYIGDDLRSSLYSLGRDPSANVKIVNDTNGNTVAMSFKAWDRNGTGNRRVMICYLYRGQSIYVNRNATSCSTSTSMTGFSLVMANVTLFRAWKDITGQKPKIGSVTPTDAPAGLPAGKGHDPQGGVVAGIPSYTVLVEVAVDDRRTRHGSRVDVLGRNVDNLADSRPRAWRYVQARPGTTVL